MWVVSTHQASAYKSCCCCCMYRTIIHAGSASKEIHYSASQVSNQTSIRHCSPSYSSKQKENILLAVGVVCGRALHILVEVQLGREQHLNSKYATWGQEGPETGEESFMIVKPMQGYIAEYYIHWLMRLPLCYICLQNLCATFRLSCSETRNSWGRQVVLLSQ